MSETMYAVRDDAKRRAHNGKWLRVKGYTVRLTDQEHALFMRARELADRENVESAGPVIRRALMAWAEMMVATYGEPTP